MKKILFILLLIIPINVASISADSYIVMDQNSGRVLKGNNYNEESLIASITKIMTAIIVIENVHDLKSEITVSEDVLKAFGSAIYIEVGEKISIENLLYGLMLRSGNDAAIVLAQEVAGSMEKFVELMNEKVEELNLENTIFHNNHGLEMDGKENISTAYDMAIITKYAMNNDTFKRISGTKEITVKSDVKTYSWTNKNRILHTEDYITGGKTGYTMKANRTLVTTSYKDNIELIVVTLNDGNDFENHKALHNEIFNNYDAVKVLDKDVTSLENNMYIKNDYYALVTEDELHGLEVKYELFDEYSGIVAGNVKVYLGDYLLYEDDIYVAEDTEKKSWWDKLIGWFKSW